MNATDIVAWTYDGAIYCDRHGPDSEGEADDDPEWSPVFADSEGWEDHACDTCLHDAVKAGERPETLGEYYGLPNPKPHYVYGSGMHGCLYDYGPNVADTLDDAVEGLLFVFGDDDSEAATEERIQEFEDDLRRYKHAELWEGAGAQYAEIAECRCWHPEEHDPEYAGDEPDSSAPESEASPE